MSKGIAIQTILLILVGTVVAGIIIYLVYIYTTTPALSTKECEARFFTWCTQCANLGRVNTHQIGTDFADDCMTKLADIGITITAATTCVDGYPQCEKVGIEY